MQPVCPRCGAVQSLATGPYGSSLVENLTQEMGTACFCMTPTTEIDQMFSQVEKSLHEAIQEMFQGKKVDEIKRLLHGMERDSPVRVAFVKRFAFLERLKTELSARKKQEKEREASLKEQALREQDYSAPQKIHSLLK